MMARLPATLDTKGRVRTSREQRRLVLAEFQRSGLSAARFAQRMGLKYSTFAGWVQRSRRTKRPRQVQPLRLLEAVVASSPTAAALTVQLPGGARIEIRDTSQVALAAVLIQALQSPCGRPPTC
jgi:transposase-like protein